MFIVAIVLLLFVIFNRRKPLLTPCTSDTKTIEYNVLSQLHHQRAHVPNIQSRVCAY